MDISNEINKFFKIKYLNQIFTGFYEFKKCFYYKIKLINYVSRILLKDKLEV